MGVEISKETDKEEEDEEMLEETERKSLTLTKIHHRRTSCDCWVMIDLQEIMAIQMEIDGEERREKVEEIGRSPPLKPLSCRFEPLLTKVGVEISKETDKEEEEMLEETERKSLKKKKIHHRRTSCDSWVMIDLQEIMAIQTEIDGEERREKVEETKRTPRSPPRKLLSCSKSASREPRMMVDLQEVMAIPTLSKTIQNIGNVFLNQDSSLLTHIYALITSGGNPAREDIQNLASVNLSQMSLATCQKYLETLNLALEKFQTSSSNKPDCIAMCNLDALQDFYIVSKDVQEVGSKVICNAYGRRDRCVESGNIINILLFLASAEEIPENFEEILNAHKVENWLQRNILHIVSIFVHDEQMLRFIPDSIISKYHNKEDLHGSTPLHVAYMHHNEKVAKFLILHGANEDSVDNFGFTPKSLGSRIGIVAENGMLRTESFYSVNAAENANRTEHMDVTYQQLCRDLMDRRGNVFEKLKPMLLLPGSEVDALCENIKKLFETLAREAGYGDCMKEVVIGGSLREKLKVGRFDEVDVQIRFRHAISDRHSFNNNLLMSLNKISWDGIHLRPVCVSNPWQFLWEKPGPTQGLTISMDVVPIFEENVPDGDSFVKQNLILKEAQMHNRMHYLKLKKVEEGLIPTYFAFEWDILDSLPMGFRLGILIVKALLEAYYWAHGKQSVSQKPLTSYMVKTAVFHILSDEEKLDFNIFPKWVDEEDLRTHAEEGRAWACRILQFISKSTFGMNNFWAYPSTIHVNHSEIEHILQCLQECLQTHNFY